MEIVIPLRVEAGVVRCCPTEMMHRVVVVLEHEVDVPLAAGSRAHRPCDLGQDVRLRVVTDRVHRIKAQPVEMEFRKPVERVVDVEVAHNAAVGTVEVDCRTPRRVMTLREELRCIQMEIVAVGAEVVVHDIEKHHQSACMRRLHEAPQIVGRAVRRLRREQQDAIVAPAAPARKLRHGHELNGRDAELRQVIQARFDGGERALMRKAADVEFVQHDFVPRPSLPAVILPLERQRIDDGARPVHVIGIEARCGIGDGVLTVDDEAVQAARARLRALDLEPAVGRRSHGMAHGGAGFMKAQRDFPSSRRPQPKPNPAIAQHFASEGHGVAPSHDAGRISRRSTSDRPVSGYFVPPAIGSRDPAPAS